MKQGQNNRRQRTGRGGGRRSYHSGNNRSLESSGPNVKLRGTANQIWDKYLALARDAGSSGDRISAENYYQHAEHYYRLMTANGQGNSNNGQGNNKLQDETVASAPASAPPERGTDPTSPESGNGTPPQSGSEEMEGEETSLS